MAENRKENIVRSLIETGSEITGSVGGVVIGGLISGPDGAIIGGVGGPIITKVFKDIGAEIKQRLLGPREAARIGGAYTFAISKINQLQQNGFQLRDDNFFDFGNNRPLSEEILEGILLSAQREHEEQKLQFLGNLYANICFNKNISRAYANQLIRTANSLTFRQYCILQLLKEIYRGDEYVKSQIDANSRKIEQLDVIAEIRDLHQRGLVHIPTTFDGGNNSLPIYLDRLSITKSGIFLCSVLLLDEIETEILDEVDEQANIR
jgi:hypothetical protein